MHKTNTRNAFLKVIEYAPIYKRYWQLKMKKSSHIAWKWKSYGLLYYYAI